MAANPFELAYESLWDAIELNTEITNIVKPGNREKYDKAIGPKTDFEIADLPLIWVQPQSTAGILHYSSSQTMLTKRYTIRITTGDWQLDPKYHKLSWELIRSLVTWCDNLGNTKWNSKSFMKRATLEDATEGTDIRQEVRDILGWELAAVVLVEMYFVTSELRIT